MPGILQSKVKYNHTVEMLDKLIDEVGEDESHPLASLMDVLSALIENYENANVPKLALEYKLWKIESNRIRK
ncbi:MAG: hypothetical protein ACR2J3_14130 [Aridibacter sp.]